jgi:FkbM family methyltransferase
MSEPLPIGPRLPHGLPERWLRFILRQAVKALVSGSRFLLGEKTLALAKLILPCLPYGKAVVVASILIKAFPTNTATIAFYCSARPRWCRRFEFRLNPYCPVSKLFSLTGLYQPEMTKKLLEINQRGTMVDIGANFGYFSVLWLSKPSADVIAIEPISQNYELLTCNLSRFGHRAKTVLCCVGERTGKATMNYDPEYPMLARISLNANTTQGQQVKMRHLGELLEEQAATIIETLKCDTEGHDVRILSSVPEIFEKKRVHTLFFEPETWKGERDPGLQEFCQFLTTHGYQLVSRKGESDLCYSVPDHSLTGSSRRL